MEGRSKRVWELNRSRLRLAWGPFVRPLEKERESVPIYLASHATAIVGKLLNISEPPHSFSGMGINDTSYGWCEHQTERWTRASSTMHACSKCGMNAARLPISMPFQPGCLQMITSFIVLHLLVGFSE